jgi:hypothetical protein
LPLKSDRACFAFDRIVMGIKSTGMPKLQAVPEWVRDKAE